MLVVFDIFGSCGGFSEGAAEKLQVSAGSSAGFTCEERPAEGGFVSELHMRRTADERS